MAKKACLSYDIYMSLKKSFEGIAGWFKGPNNRAQIDIAQNTPVAGSKRAMQMVIAALTTLGIMSHTPRNYLHTPQKSAPEATHKAPSPKYKG